MHLLNPKICTFEIKNEVFRQTAVSRHPKKRPCKQKRLTIWTAKRKEKVKTVILLDLKI